MAFSSKTAVFIAAIVALTASAAVTGYLLYKSHHAAGTPPHINPYEYDISAYKSIPAPKTAYGEKRVLDTGMKNLKCIEGGQHSFYFVNGNEIYQLGEMDYRKLFTLNISPNCVAFEPKTSVFYAGAASRVYKFDAGGNQAGEPWDFGEQAVIVSIATGGPSNVFMADAGQRVVWHFSADGKLLNKIDPRNPAASGDGFIVPSPYFDVFIGNNEKLWVVNPGKLKLERYSFEGKFEYSWGTSSMSPDGFCGCCNPVHAAFLPDGSFVTAEKGIPRVKIYNSSGGFEGLITGPAQFSEDTILNIAADDGGRIAVMDPKSGIIRIYEKASRLER
jgi:hypothetical protein